MEWNERAISQKAWQRRQQSGEYDATSMASSVAKKGEAAVMANGSGGRLAQRPQGDAMVLVPYGREQNAGFGRRAASQTELRSPVDTFFADTPRRIPPPGMPPFYFGPPLSPSSAFPPFLPPGPSPSMAAFMHSQPPPHFFSQRPHHLFPPPPPFPFHPPPAPPHFGRSLVACLLSLLGTLKFGRIFNRPDCQCPLPAIHDAPLILYATDLCWSPFATNYSPKVTGKNGQWADYYGNGLRHIPTNKSGRDL